MTQILFSQQLHDLIDRLRSEANKILDDRQVELDELAKNILSLLSKSAEVNVVFICTHNSRRSQLAEIWLRLAIEIMGMNNFKIASGGTEQTAFNHRMIYALEAAGFQIEKMDDSINPKYQQLNAEKRPFGPNMYSKVFDAVLSNTTSSMAVMVCDSAAEACPHVANATLRSELLYKDPKVSDGSESESLVYIEKVEEIGREMLYLADRLNE
jgi:protein-tyrosine-phosphatase